MYNYFVYYVVNFLLIFPTVIHAPDTVKICNKELNCYQHKWEAFKSCFNKYTLDIITQCLCCPTEGDMFHTNTQCDISNNCYENRIDAFLKCGNDYYRDDFDCFCCKIIVVYV